jgi:outer membrane protein assembly factor BamB
MRDGKSPDTGLMKSWPEGGPPLLWHAQGIGKGYSTVAVVDGKVYTTGVIGERLVISIFDSEGKRIAQVPHDIAWTKNYPGGRSTPMIDDGRLYLISGNGLVGCYDLPSMQKKWAVHMSDFGGSPPEWGYAESVLILGELAVITPGGDKCIVALKKSTGQPVWTSSGFSAAAQYGSCYAFEFGGVPIIAAGTHGGLVGVDARNGRAIFSNPFASGNTASCPTPVAADGYVFWAAGYGKGGICMKLEGARDRIAAQQAWTTEDMDCHHGGYIIHEGHIYGNNGGRGWSCIELATGNTVWTERGVGKGSVCFADGMLYLFSENGGRAGLATCSPAGLEMRGEFSVEGEDNSWAHPVVIGGRLYLRYADNLYCFNVTAE